MADVQTTAAIIFIFLLTLILYLERKKITIQKIFFPVLYFVMYKTKIGLNFMNWSAKKYQRFFRYFGYFGVAIGFLGMILISVALLTTFYKLFFVPAAPLAVGLVLPFKVKGSFFVPFFYWIISIFIIAVVHEFSHGVIARVYDMKLKSSGFAFLGVILPVLPAAFVEPDEKEVQKRPRIQQLSMFAAGPFSNIVLAFLVLIFTILVFSPVLNAMIDDKGVLVEGFMEDAEGNFPAKDAGMKEGELILKIDDNEFGSLENFSLSLQNKSPGDTILIGTNVSEYNLTLGSNPQDINKSFMGISINTKRIKPSFIEKYGSVLPSIIFWISGLLFWLYVLNLGIGLFNLVPLGPVDGGRMLHSVLLKFFEKRKAEAIWKAISLIFIILLVIIILAGFVR